MDKLQELRESLNTAITAMRAMLDVAEKEERELSDDETSKYDSLKAETVKIQSKIKREEDLVNIENQTSQPVARVLKPAQPIIETSSVYSRARYGKLKAFKGARAEERAYDAGMWVRAALFGDDIGCRRTCL